MAGLPPKKAAFEKRLLYQTEASVALTGKVNLSQAVIRKNAVFIFVFQSSTLHIFCWTLDYFAYNSSLYYLQHKELKL